MKTLLYLLVLPAALALVSCTTPEKYYRLSADGPPPPTGAGFSLGVGPVALPDYIDRPELVFQSSEERFEVPFERRWAGSLRDTTTRAIATNLARRLGTGNVHVYPWAPGTPLDYQIRVYVRQFHGRSGGDAILEVTWTVEDGHTGRVFVRRGGNYVEPVVIDGYEGIVAAENKLLSRFSKDIAESFRAR